MSNRKNPAVKRILADVRELQTHPSSRYFAAPLEDNMFEWHFTIRGPADSAFADGIYHGRILLPTDYPFKPPNIVFLTKNGRFEVGTKICLSISAYHEESWQPAWGVRTMLEAIISFMPSEGMGAIGALDWTVEERKKLAAESKNYVCSLCGKVSDLLSDPALDVSPSTETDPLALSKQALDAATMAESIAQLGMRPAKTPHSPHVHGNHTLSGELPSAGLNIKVSSFAAELDVTPFGLQEGTSNFDLISTTVSAPPLEDSDGVADFLPDLSERMSEFDNNNIDAEDNFDAIGMMETLPRGSAGESAGAIVGSGSAISGVGGGSIGGSTDGGVVADLLHIDAATGTNAIDLTTTIDKSTQDSPKKEENRKVSADYLTSPSNEFNATEINNNTENTTTTTHDHSFCCGGHSHTHSHSHSHVHSPIHTTINTTVINTNPDTNNNATTTDEAEAERQQALQEIEQARAHLVHRLQGVDRALAVAVNRIQLAEERLAQNLEQVPQGNVQLGGVRVMEVVANNNENHENNGNLVAERDIVDEWLTVLLIAIGTSVALMAWRIVLRYYSLFLF